MAPPWRFANLYESFPFSKHEADHLLFRSRVTQKKDRLTQNGHSVHQKPWIFLSLFSQAAVLGVYSGPIR